ncbi:MAG: ribosome maturation factor RimM [Defluviitaleaceae bacterium]|nr:ribosome maturation factor RimM [Defluviitaleaceae bacterium]
MDNWFKIGIIVKPQGIRGELRVLPTTDDPNRFGLLNEVLLRLPKGQETMYKVTSARPHKGLVLVCLEGIGDRNAAEKLVRGVLLVPPEEALPLDKDEYFIRDLVGLKVETEDGQVLGIIEDVFPTGANDVYIVRDDEGKSFMLPAIKDVVQAVSLEAGTMIVRLIDGLLELTV